MTESELIEEGASHAENLPSPDLLCDHIWNVIPLPTETLEGGMILMMQGQKVPMTTNNIWEGVVESLITHSGNLCHCINYSEVWELVDYDPFGTSFGFARGALFDSRGPRLRDDKVGQDVDWLKMITRC